MPWLTLFGGLATLCVVAVPAQATHPRPKSAHPIRQSLVPAYNQCTAPNRTHGPPLAFQSCNPPGQASAQATVGTPDANGAGVNSTAYLELETLAGLPGPPQESDIPITIEINDVRCVPTGARCSTANASGPADYSGQAWFSFLFRRTDHNNAVAPGGGTDPATGEDFLFESAMSCTETASTSIGSRCGANTTMNVIVPGAAQPDAKRAIWELHDVRIYDGGADGDGSTTADNTLFMRPGVFIP